ncbi:MAG: thioredoxin-dependent thiol peroxidase [Rikenellaceae bacterium]|nr:thioredoxin-dependent thiol peroxidase [Rikenellaceae bacterium]
MEKLRVGDMAPDFTAKDQNGKDISLSGFRGRRVILYFYPKDNTPGCTLEAKSLRDGKAELGRQGFEIVGVSPDSAKSHCNFIDKHQLNFTLIADTDTAVAQQYGVWGEKKFMGKTYMGIIRTTFVIDPEGRIEKIFDKVDTARHFEQILEAYKQ